MVPHSPRAEAQTLTGIVGDDDPIATLPTSRITATGCLRPVVGVIVSLGLLAGPVIWALNTDTHILLTGWVGLLLMLGGAHLWNVTDRVAWARRQLRGHLGDLRPRIDRDVSRRVMVWIPVERRKGASPFDPNEPRHLRAATRLRSVRRGVRHGSAGSRRSSPTTTPLRSRRRPRTVQQTARAA